MRVPNAHQPANGQMMRGHTVTSMIYAQFHVNEK